MRCGLLGKTLGHSLSPQLHSFFGDYEYRLYECAEEELSQLLHRSDLRGLNVTIPYKQTVLPYCDCLSQTAAAAGSVNTLVYEDGKCIGDNTDVYGFEKLLDRSHISVTGKKVLVLGSGGASKAVQLVLHRRSAEFTVISRSGEDNYVNLSKHTDADIIVNATPVGMYPENGTSLIDLTPFARCETVIDLIYNPAMTALLLQAEQLGKQAVNGLYMLAAQAKRASELFQDQELSEELTELAYQSLAAQMQNIILIGMPSSGKTTVGQLLAAQLGRPFYDSDAVFENQFDLSPGEYLLQNGEPAFRERETAVLQELCKQTGCVIATGGGAVTVPQNLPVLRRNGKLVYLERPLSDLSVQGRPLSQSAGVEALAAQRLPLYRAWADLTVSENSPQAAADKIKEVFCL